MKRRVKKNGFKLNNQKNKILASDPITGIERKSLANRREKVETVTTDFLFLGSNITVDDDCSHGNKTASWKGYPLNLDSAAKSRNSTFLTKVRVLTAKAVVFTSHV